ncbi:MAG: bifunctional tetrahydrofolate synthase/dihydrofolate synthase [Cycloclasticus sp.]|nr:bifunctional tetrahydrofolate synthase/dihydrofolate synthase [Cycloclasticus sp.]MBQ0789276.1 bifunctional tetrahydrofolate synthase/dihydrofolate synthase [Cycloclasticus sp.]
MLLSDTSSLDSWLSWQEQCHPIEIDLGLQRVASVYQRLKSNAAKRVFTITVGGTNGKGSCVAMLEAILIHAGYQVGVYSTPHIQRYNERVRLNGQSVADELLTASFHRINQARTTTSLSYFEFGTLAALDIFAQGEVDVQILEVGLGGRLDAVNIIDADAALISSIDVDHTAWLGSDKSAIALEKAGIFRANQKAVCGDKNVPQSLLDYARSIDTDLWLAGRDFNYQSQTGSWQIVAVNGCVIDYPLPALKGEHQLQNAAAVISLLAHIAADLPLSKEAVDAGLIAVNLPGRLQQIGAKPDVFLDVAHNPESARTLAKFLRTYPRTGRVCAVFSILEDKDLNKVLQPFIGLIDHWHIAPLTNLRAQTTDVIADNVSHVLNQPYTVYGSIGEAYKGVLASLDEDDLVICFGSFYVVEACLDAL